MFLFVFVLFFVRVFVAFFVCVISRIGTGDLWLHGLIAEGAGGLRAERPKGREVKGPGSLRAGRPKGREA